MTGAGRIVATVTAAFYLGGCPPTAPQRAAIPAADADRFVYVGTYTGPDVPPDGRRPSTARGIYVFQMRASDGHLMLVQVAKTDNPSYLALDPTLTHLYCTNQNDLVDGVPAGRVSAYAVNAADGTLTFLDSQPTHGTHPAHLSVHPSGAYLLASNYGGGDYPVFRLLADGSIGALTDDVHSGGSGPDRDRQEGPHAHQILTDPDARHVFGVDLGADKILIWNLDQATGRLIANESPAAAVPPGSGPRHMVFHPNGRFAYVLNELSGTITTFEYDASRGALLPAQTVSTLPPSFTGSKSTAEIRIHPSGRFLYSTNRGNDSIAIFAIDERTGMLQSLGWQSTQGEWPRGMNIDPSGAFLYAANQNSDTIVVFRIDPSTGKLAPTGETVSVPAPADIEFGGALRRFPPSSPNVAVDPTAATEPIEWQLTASATTLQMADRGEFELWIVAHNASTHASDTRRDGLEYLVNGRVSFVLAMAFGNGLREGRWSALPPGDTVREARGGPTEPDIGQGLFPGPGNYELTLRQGGRVVATLHVSVTSSP